MEIIRYTVDVLARVVDSTLESWMKLILVLIILPLGFFLFHQWDGQKYAREWDAEEAKYARELAAEEAKYARGLAVEEAKYARELAAEEAKAAREQEWERELKYQKWVDSDRARTPADKVAIVGNRSFGEFDLQRVAVIWKVAHPIENVHASVFRGQMDAQRKDVDVQRNEANSTPWSLLFACQIICWLLIICLIIKVKRMRIV